MWSYKMGKFLTITKLETAPKFNYNPGTADRIYECYISPHIVVRVELYNHNVENIRCYIHDERDYHQYSVPDVVRKICEYWIKDPDWGGLQFHEYVGQLVIPPIMMKDRGKQNHHNTIG